MQAHVSQRDMYDHQLNISRKLCSHVKAHLLKDLQFIIFAGITIT